MRLRRCRGKALLLSILAGTAWLGVSAPEAQTAAAVTVRDSGSSVHLDNGVISVTIIKSSAMIKSLIYQGREMTTEGIYYSMDGGADYSNPDACVYSAKVANPEIADLAFHSRWTGNRTQAFDIEIHYVLRKGQAGLYTYAVLDHPAAYPATSVGEWRIAWKLSSDFFEKLFVDSLRNTVMPSSADMAKGKVMPIKEATWLTTGPRAGTYECKYNYNAEYYALGAYGHASDVHKMGAWMVMGGRDYLNDGPTKQDLTAHYGLLLHHFNRNHYDASAIRADAGESWRKIYGPLLLYFNAADGGADSCWADAKARAVLEEKAWPYAWLTGDTGYAPESLRGSVQGTLSLRDAESPAKQAANAWVGLAGPASGGNWQFDGKAYQYWARTDGLGRFDIRHVRAGTYSLYGFADGETGEFMRTGIKVDAGKAEALGELAWKPMRQGPLLWEIGTPNRSAREFRHGQDYFHAYLWESFPGEFKNPLEYFVGKSDWKRDWNYAHTSYDSAGVPRPWKWRIHFTLEKELPPGQARLQLAIAGANRSAVQVFVNDENAPWATAPMVYNAGNSLWRQAIHDKYFIDTVLIPTSKFHPGENILTLVATGTTASGSVVMYDYLRLEGTEPLVGIPPREGAHGSDPLHLAASGVGKSGIQVRYSLPQGSRIRLRLRALDGRNIRTQDMGYQEAGPYAVDFEVPSMDPGLYILECRSGSTTERLRIALPSSSK